MEKFCCLPSLSHFLLRAIYFANIRIVAVLVDHLKKFFSKLEIFVEVKVMFVDQ